MTTPNPEPLPTPSRANTRGERWRQLHLDASQAQAELDQARTMIFYRDPRKGGGRVNVETRLWTLLPFQEWFLNTRHDWSNAGFMGRASISAKVLATAAAALAGVWAVTALPVLTPFVASGLLGGVAADVAGKTLVRLRMPSSKSGGKTWVDRIYERLERWTRSVTQAKDFERNTPIHDSTRPQNKWQATKALARVMGAVVTRRRDRRQSIDPNAAFPPDVGPELKRLRRTMQHVAAEANRIKELENSPWIALGAVMVPTMCGVIVRAFSPAGGVLVFLTEFVVVVPAVAVGAMRTAELSQQVDTLTNPQRSPVARRAAHMSRSVIGDARQLERDSSGLGAGPTIREPMPRPQSSEPRDPPTVPLPVHRGVATEPAYPTVSNPVDQSDPTVWQRPRGLE